MSKKVKNQHYVPRMYLKRFSENKNKISVIDLKKDIILTNQNIKNYAAIRYFYDSDIIQLKELLKENIELYPDISNYIDNSKDEQFAEKYLSRLESDINNIIDLICNNPKEIDNEENFLKLIIFIHDLAYRTEKFRNDLDNINNPTLNNLSKFGITPDKVKNFSGNSKKEQLYQILGIRPLLKTMKMLLENYNHYIGIVKGDMNLIVSDNPAYQIMLGFNDICIPLSSKVALIFRINDLNAPIISKDMPLDNIIELSWRSVLVYNSLQLSQANRFIFGDKNSLSYLKNISNILDTLKK